MPLYLNESPARKHFKQALGNANHLLVTILVGLIAVEKGLITECPPELHTSWNPVNAVASANRSRVMALEMALVRATDALDVYIRLARRKPSLIPDGNLQQAIDGSNRSIFKKFNAIREIYLPSGEAAIIAAIIEVMIVWRNRQVHSDDDNQVSLGSWNTLKENADWIKNSFRGMEIERLFSDFSKEAPPKFKEIASFIRATHEAVRITDAQMLRELDPTKFIKRLIWVRAGEAIESENEDGSRKKLIQSIWGRDSSDRTQRVISFLKNCGLSESVVDAGSASEFSNELIDLISSKKPSELMEWLRS